MSKIHYFSCDSWWYNFPAVAALRLPTTQAIFNGLGAAVILTLVEESVPDIRVKTIS